MSNKLISYKNAIDTMDDIKSKKIDIKATIENTKKADFLGIEESYCQPINLDNFMPADFSELVGSEDLSPNEYYENVFKYLEKCNGIYIALCYLVDGIGIDEDNLKFNDNSSLEDDYLIIVDKDFEELIAEYHELDTDFLDENNDEYSSYMIDNAFHPASVKCLSKMLSILIYIKLFYLRFFKLFQIFICHQSLVIVNISKEGLDYGFYKGKYT